MTRTAQAIVFSGAGQPLRLERFAAADPVDDEVLARIIGCTLCGSDLHTVEGRRTAPTPTILGHEILGRIEAFGPVAARRDFAGHDLHVGDRVTWSIVSRCGECFYCLRNLPQKCERMLKYGHEPLRPGRELTGGLATHCLLATGTALLRVPESLADETACPANCATATVAAALYSAPPVSGRTVLILGAGMLGLTACAMARSLDAAAIVACDMNPTRLQRTASFGATHQVAAEELAQAAKDLTSGHGFDLVLELTGSPAAVENAWPHVRMGGQIILVGSVFPSRPMPLLLEQVVRRQLLIRGIHNYAPKHLAMALAFLEQEKQAPFAELVSQWLPLADAERAFEAAKRPEAFRIGVRP